MLPAAYHDVDGPDDGRRSATRPCGSRARQPATATTSSSAQTLEQRRQSAVDDHPRGAAHRRRSCSSSSSWAPSPSAGGSRRPSSGPASASSSSPPTRRTSCARRCRSSRPTRASRSRRTRSVEWYRDGVRAGRPRDRKRMRRLLDDLLWLARFDATQRPAERRAGRPRRPRRPDRRPLRDRRREAPADADRRDAAGDARDHRAARVARPAARRPARQRLQVLARRAARSRLASAGDGSRVRLTVDDAGPGIPEEERDADLRPLPPRRPTRQGGAGLGLAIADAIVRATNGRWRIGTSPAGGASMSVSWTRETALNPRARVATPLRHQEAGADVRIVTRFGSPAVRSISRVRARCPRRRIRPVVQASNSDRRARREPAHPGPARGRSLSRQRPRSSVARRPASSPGVMMVPSSRPRLRC